MHLIYPLTQDALNETLKISAKIKEELDEQKDLHTRQSNIITDITTELNHKTIQLLEVDIQRLQTAISEKDASLALLEMKEEVSCVQQRSYGRQEKARLMKELKNKVIIIMFSYICMNVYMLYGCMYVCICVKVCVYVC